MPDIDITCMMNCSVSSAIYFTNSSVGTFLETAHCWMEETAGCVDLPESPPLVLGAIQSPQVSERLHYRYCQRHFPVVRNLKQKCF